MKTLKLLSALAAILLTTTAGSAATFTEDFEKTPIKGNYTDGDYVGTGCTWTLTNAGVYSDTKGHNSTKALRLGNNSTSQAVMASNKSGGAGYIEFYAAEWSTSDGAATIVAEYSTDNGSTWKTAGTASVSATTYQAYKYTVNVSGNVRLRLRQTAGKRALIDDVTITDYTSSSSATASISSPKNGSTVDFGTVEANKTSTQSVVVKGTGLTEAVSVSVSGTGFSANTTTLSASKVNGTSGGTVQVNFKGTSGGSYTGTLTLKTGSTTVKVNLKATVSGSGTTTPTVAITSPANNSTVNFGTVEASKTSTQSVNVKGTGLTSAVTVSVSGTGFTANTTSLSASKVNGTSGSTVQVNFKSASAGTFSGTLTLKSGTVTTKVNLKATVASTGSSGGTTTTTAKYTTPAAGSTVDFSTVTANKSKTTTVVVKGTGLTEATTVTVTGTGFKTGSTTLSATKVNSTDGAQLQVVFKAADAGTYKGTLKLTSGKLSRSVSLKAVIPGTSTAAETPSTPSTPSTPTDPGVVSGNEPSGYYSTAEGKYGQALLTALKTKITSHTAVSYAKLWTAFKETDTKANGKIWDMYSTKEFTYSTNQCGNYTRIGDCYNREHSFPKSWFNEATPMYTDLFHVIPTDGVVNNQRGNSPFGECANGTYVAANGSVRATGKLGKSTLSGYTGTVWEPDDEYKGDFARSYFYMVTAYNDKVKSWKSDMLAGNAYPAFSTWAIDMLLKWNSLDPVSQKEVDRQEAVYAKQKNRNPFIDHPELAEYIWGSKKTTAWNAAAANSAVITYPANGSTLNFGTVATQASNEKLVNVKGVRVTDDVNVTIQGNGFDASAEWLSADQVNQLNTSAKAPSLKTATADDDAEPGAWLKITFSVQQDSEYDATLTLTSGNVVNKVSLKGRARDGLPAAEAEDITADGFTARWVDVDDTFDDGTYRLDVADENGMLDGYPVYVQASELTHRVEGLNPNTEYIYTLTSETMQSNTVLVQTGDVIPSIVFVYANGALDIETKDSTPSEAVEIALESEYINGNATLAVDAPFEISDDKTSWSQSVTIDPYSVDRIYLRLGAAAVGQYLTSVRATAANYFNDALVAEARVIGNTTIVEDFEADANGHDTYTTHTYTGTAGAWDMENAGIWPYNTTNQFDVAKSGTQAVRMGKNTDSSITLKDAVASSIASVTVHAAKYNKDADATFALQYSMDNGGTWNDAGSATVTTTDYAPFVFTVNANLPAQLRIQQTAGARFLVDDVTITPGSTSAPDIVGDTYSQWTAYSAAHGTLTIESAIDGQLSIVGMDGRIYNSGRVAQGTTALSLPAGLYIVNVDDTARRVLVK